jgi:hypothetical protein
MEWDDLTPYFKGEPIQDVRGWIFYYDLFNSWRSYMNGPAFFLEDLGLPFRSPLAWDNVPKYSDGRNRDCWDSP